MIDLSIIVPIYNMENYLKRCVDSICNFDNNSEQFEILLINDGSTDDSAVICQQYVRKYPFIRYIERENGGLSDARNAGILEARGTYIAFVDSDDYIDANALHEIFIIARKKLPDIVVGEACHETTDMQIRRVVNRELSHEKVVTGEQFLLKNLQDRTMVMCAPYNLYKRTFLLESNIFFEKGLLHEDELWTPQMFLKAKSVCYCNVIFYYHVTRADSITHKKNQKRNAKDIIYICNKLCPIYKQFDEPLRKELLDYLAVIYMGAYEKGKLYQEKVDREFPYQYGYRKSTKMKAELLKMSGPLFCVCYSIFRKVAQRCKEYIK